MLSSARHAGEHSLYRSRRRRNPPESLRQEDRACIRSLESDTGALRLRIHRRGTPAGAPIVDGAATGNLSGTRDRWGLKLPVRSACPRIVHRPRSTAQMTRAATQTPAHAPDLAAAARMGRFARCPIHAGGDDLDPVEARTRIPNGSSSSAHGLPDGKQPHETITADACWHMPRTRSAEHSLRGHPRADLRRHGWPTWDRRQTAPSRPASHPGRRDFTTSR